MGDNLQTKYCIYSEESEKENIRAKRCRKEKQIHSIINIMNKKIIFLSVH